MAVLHISDSPLAPHGLNPGMSRSLSKEYGGRRWTSARVHLVALMALVEQRDKRLSYHRLRLLDWADTRSFRDQLWHRLGRTSAYKHWRALL